MSMISGQRLSLAEIRDKLQDEIFTTIPEAYFGTGLDVDFSAKFGKPAPAGQMPAYWVVSQRAVPTDSGRGYTGLKVQNQRTEVGFCLQLQRAPVPGITGTPEERLTAMVNAFNNALFGWRPTHAVSNFSFVSQTDGPMHESIISTYIVLWCDVRMVAR